MIIKIIDIEQWTTNEFILTFGNAEQRIINLKNTLESLNKKNNTNTHFLIREDNINAFHLTSDGNIEWSFGGFKIDSSEAFELSESYHLPDIRNVPYLISRIMCIDEQDVIASIGINEEEYEFWKIDVSSSVKITNLMLFALNNMSLLNSLDDLKNSMKP